MEQTCRVDGLQSVLSAICQIKGVLSAKANVADHAEFMAEERARHELGERLWAVLYPKG